MIKENLSYVEQQIARACEKVGRNREEVTLIAVSKTKPVSLIDEAIDYGIREFGENKVQEIMDKYETVKTPVNWHMIGHLQRNKVKYIVDKVCLIHSVDSYRLAEMIDNEAAKKGVICDILIEVNIAKEDTKYGVMENEVIPLIEQVSKLSNIRIKGLMTIAPFVENSEKNRVHFRKLRNLYVDIKTKNIDNVDMKILSMGMTNDYEVAIEEGATMVRVGTGIFGERDYTI
ncbi:YggS family pyridoxal phosphate-dependent enzyme [Anaerosporobacter sp.]